MKPFNPARKALFLIIVVAIGLRLVSAFYQGNKVSVLPGIYDQISYDSLAQRLVSGYGFSFAKNHWPITRAGEPTAHWSFLYTFYLAAIYAILGPQPLVARVLQAILVGALQTYLMYRIGEKTFSRKVGLITAGVSAIYLYFIYYSGALMTEPFYITAILASLFAAMQIVENNNRPKDMRLGIVLGITISIAVLLRQVFLLFLPFLFLWIVFARFRRRLSLPLLPMTLAAGILILSILPISLYNQTRFGRFVLLNTNSGYAFFWGNHPIYGTKFIPILPEEMGTYGNLIPEEVRHLDEAALDQELLRRGLQFVRQDPARYILLSISRIPAYFMFWPTSESGLVSNLSRVASFGIFLPFMVYGLILAGQKTQREKGNLFPDLLASHEGLLMVFALLYTLVHLLTWALIRYRLPVDAVLMPFAALAICQFYKRAFEKREPGKGPPYILSAERPDRSG